VFTEFHVWKVSKRVSLQRAFSAGQSIFAYERSSDMTKVFLDIADSFDETFDKRTTDANTEVTL
jgi:chromosome partitioning protein